MHQPCPLNAPWLNPKTLKIRNVTNVQKCIHVKRTGGRFSNFMKNELDISTSTDPIRWRTSEYVGVRQYTSEYTGIHQNILASIGVFCRTLKYIAVHQYILVYIPMYSSIFFKRGTVKIHNVQYCYVRQCSVYAYLILNSLYEKYLGVYFFICTELT